MLCSPFFFLGPTVGGEEAPTSAQGRGLVGFGLGEREGGLGERGTPALPDYGVCVGGSCSPFGKVFCACEYLWLLRARCHCRLASGHAVCECQQAANQLPLPYPALPQAWFPCLPCPGWALLLAPACLCSGPGPPQWIFLSSLRRAGGEKIRFLARWEPAAVEASAEGAWAPWANLGAGQSAGPLGLAGMPWLIWVRRQRGKLGEGQSDKGGLFSPSPASVEAPF